MRIFISYKSSSLSFAQGLYDFLTEQKIECWLDRKNILLGQDWRASIEDALRSCSHMILLLSPDSLLSEEVKAEWNYFLDNRKPILPIIIEQINDLPSRLRIIQWLDLSKRDFNESFGLIFEVLLTSNEKSATQPVADNSIFVLKDVFDEHYFAKNAAIFTSRILGIRYKEKYSSAYYFIRQQIYDHFTDFLGGGKNVMVLTGKAGSGKSSFVCDIAHKTKDLVVWLQDCAHLQLSAGLNLQGYIASSLKYPNIVSGLPTFIEFLTSSSQPTLFIFDAVNEYENPEQLLVEISEFASVLRGSNVKILLSCRMPNWGTIKRYLSIPSEMEYHTSGPNSYVAVEGFVKQESELAYDQYRKTFNIMTSYNELSSHIREFLTQPLFMKLLALSYAGKEIPEKLGIEDVFRAYVAKCLGKDEADYESEDYKRKYKVLARAIELMFERARRELELTSLVEDQSLRQSLDFTQDFGNAYNQLLSEGILTQRSEETAIFMKSFEVVFVTYELVFEYLLANIVINPASIEKINRMLDIAQQRAFTQLRGAAELSLSFAIIKGYLNNHAVVELARSDRAESRQFLSDVLQTMFVSGHRPQVITIIELLIADDSNSAKILAMQASYQMKLDNYLIRLCIAKSEFVRNMAILFLYQRWNKARLEGRLQDGYDPLHQIASKIRLNHPQTSLQYVTTLSFLSLNMIAHAIDDKKSLIPLIEIWKDLARKVPGIQTDAKAGLYATINKIMFGGIVEVVTQIIKYTVRGSVLDDLNHFWSNQNNFRPFLDSVTLRDQSSLVPFEKDLLKLMTWEHQLVNYVMCAPLISHVYEHLEETSELLQQISYNADEKQSRVKYAVAHALIFGGLFRLMREREIPDGYLTLLVDSFMDYWISSNEEMEGGQRRHQKEGTVTKTFEDSLLVLLVGMLNVEARLQRMTGKVTGSQFVCDFITSPAIQDIDSDQAILFVKAVERYAYQGFPEFGIYTMLMNDFRSLWEEKCQQEGYKALANIRAYFQQEVDSIIREDSERNRKLFNSVRMIEGLPESKDVLFTNNTFWMLGGAIELNIGKILGILLMQITKARSIEEFARLASKTIVDTLFNYDTINIAIIEWYKSHDPAWNNYEANEIPMHLLNERLDLHDIWSSVAREFIEKYGKGVVYKEE